MNKFKFWIYERYWQLVWKKNIASMLNLTELDIKSNFFPLDMFPYPSSSGLHIGHPLGYLATDIISKYKRSLGNSVLHRMGWDAFGLPSEQHSILQKLHPSINIRLNIKNFKKQLESLGIVFNWNDEINTTDKNYFKFTQLFFLIFFQKNLTNVKKLRIIWCSELMTALSNEEVINGLSERGKYPVRIKYLNQWALNIKKYSNYLIWNLKNLKWPFRTKKMQFKWISGAKYSYMYSNLVKNLFLKYSYKSLLMYFITVNTIIPISMWYKYKHTLNNLFTINRITRIKNKIKAVTLENEILLRKSRINKTFLKKIINLNQIDGLRLTRIKNKLIWIQKLFTIMYKINLKNWVFSRQRTWGEPFPIIWITDSDFKIFKHYIEFNRNPIKNLIPKDRITRIHLTVEYTALPINWRKLPIVNNYLNLKLHTLKGVLVRSFKKLKTSVLIKFGILINCFTDKNIMPQWAGSCWYYLSYIDSKLNKNLVKEWGRPNFYIGGFEHAVLHLLYSRFWNYILYEKKIIFYKEPFIKLMHQGLMLNKNLYMNKFSFKNKLNSFIKFKFKAKDFLKNNLKITLYRKNEKMSKTSSGSISPTKIINIHGSDAMRFYELYIGNFERTKNWNDYHIQMIRDFILNLYCCKWDKSFNVEFDYYKFKFQNLLNSLEFYKFNKSIKDAAIYLYLKNKLIITNLFIWLKIFFYIIPHVSEELALRLGLMRSVSIYKVVNTNINNSILYHKYLILEKNTNFNFFYKNNFLNLSSKKVLKTFILNLYFNIKLYNIKIIS